MYKIRSKTAILQSIVSIHLFFGLENPSKFPIGLAVSYMDSMMMATGGHLVEKTIWFFSLFLVKKIIVLSLNVFFLFLFRLKIVFRLVGKVHIIPGTQPIP